MINLPPGPSSTDSIRYQQSLQQLDRVLEITKKMIGDSDSSSDSDQEEDSPASNTGINQEVRRQSRFIICVKYFLGFPDEQSFSRTIR